jgi:hypothetical protein
VDLSEVFHKFNEFQNLVERLFNRKIVAIKTDWGVNTRNFTPFLSKLESLILCRVLMLINKTGLRNENIDILLKLG